MRCSKLVTNRFVAKPYPSIIYINYKKSYKTICEKYSVVDLLKHDTFGRKFSAAKPMVYFPYSTRQI